MAFQPFIFCFLGEDNGTYYGASQTATLPSGECVGFRSIEALDSGNGGVKTTIKKVLPSANLENPIICIGVNYRNHAEEAKLTVPGDPVMWYKPAMALTGPGEVSIPAFAHSQFLDFGGELTIITSKTAYNVSEADAHEYVLGYTVGNDLTARGVQNPARAGGQFTRAKSWDCSAPLAHMVARLPNPSDLASRQLITTVNGKVFQNSPVDLIHGPAKLISFLSQGTTIPAGTAIMTGTASGVGFFCEPKHALQHGDVVEVEITGLQRLRNKMVFT